MFCGKCGADNQPGTKFCAVCGAPCEETGNPFAPAKKPDVVETAKNFVKEPKNRPILIGVAVALVVIILAIILFSGRSWKGTIDDMVEGICEGDGDKIVSLLPDEFYEEEDEDPDELAEDLTDEMEEFVKEIEDYSYEIKDDDDITGKRLRQIKERYEDEYDLKVKEAKEVEVKITVEVDGDKEKDTITVTLVKIGSSWYLDYYSFSYIVPGF